MDVLVLLSMCITYITIVPILAGSGLMVRRYSSTAVFSGGPHVTRIEFELGLLLSTFRVVPFKSETAQYTYANRLLVMDYRHTETSISGTYLTRILVNLKSASRQKHHQKSVGGILVLHNNTLTHNPKLAQAIVEPSEFEKLSRPVYSIDQSSSEHCLI